MEDRETPRMRKYAESKTTRIMMATVPHVISGSGLIKFQADGFLLDRVYLFYWKLGEPQGQSRRVRGRENLSLSSGLEHQDLQPVASRYSVYNIASPSFFCATYLKGDVNSRGILAGRRQQSRHTFMATHILMA